VPKEIKIKMKDLLDFNLKNRINNVYELGLVDPNEGAKTVDKSLRMLHNDDLADYSTLLDM